jgi:hypothetical protein
VKSPPLSGARERTGGTPPSCVRCARLALRVKQQCALLSRRPGAGGVKAVGVKREHPARLAAPP